MTPRLSLLLVAALLPVAVTTLSIGHADATDSTQVVLTARMTAEEEVPHPGPPGANGTALISIDEAEQQLCYQISYAGIPKATAGHIHRGSKGASGPVVIDLDIADNGNKACLHTDRGTLDEIAGDPGAHYIDLHTTDYPDGAMRGQCHRGPLTAPGTW
jgi:hypothetical protein